MSNSKGDEMKRTVLCILVLLLLLIGCGSSEAYTNSQVGKMEADSSMTEAIVEKDNDYDYDYVTSDKGNNQSNDSAYEMGKNLGNELSEKMESVDWEEKYENAEEMGAKAADYLNKLMQ